MKNKILLLPFLFIMACSSINQGASKSLHTEDAQKFASLINNNANVAENDLQTKYLNSPSLGIEIFTPYRIENAKNLHENLMANIEKYRHAANVCLPVVIGMEKETDKILGRMANLLGEKESAPVYILFGANNSGGTANAKGLAIGLEVICDGKTKDNAKSGIEALIAHEIVHVYQNRNFTDDMKVDLLFVAIMEGGADFIADLALGKKQSDTTGYGKYGNLNEVQLWHEFKQDYENGVFNNNDWFYSKGRNGRPNDLGYFVGKKICEAYYARAKDKQLALQELVRMKDPKKILEQSGYNPKN